MEHTFKNLKVLICDDSLLARKRLADLLKQYGCEQIFEAPDGEKAVSLFKSISPDLVFMDIVMPVKTGIEALKEIKADDKNAKIVMVSSAGTQSHLTEALQAGAVDFIQKPIDPEMFEHLVNNLAKNIL